MKWYFKLIIRCLVVFLVFGCTDTTDKKIPDVSSIDISPNFHWTMDQLQKFHEEEYKNLDSMMRVHPVFYNLYIKQLIKIRKPISALDTGFTREWSSFIHDSSTQMLFFKIDSIYQDHEKVERAMTKSLKYFKHHFPKHQIPEVYFTNSSLSIANFLFENVHKKESVAVGLDFFLGKSFPYLALARINPIFSNFMSRNFDESHLISRTMMSIVEDLVGPQKGSRMLDIMIHNGKKLYILESLMPYEKMHILMNYSKDELLWCNDNKRDIWAYFIDEKLFYETTSKRIITYINPAPNSKGMPSESPGETANFMGYNIVTSYMQRHPDLSLEGLISLHDSQEIMDQSKFKP